MYKIPYPVTDADKLIDSPYIELAEVFSRLSIEDVEMEEYAVPEVSSHTPPSDIIEMAWHSTESESDIYDIINLEAALIAKEKRRCTYKKHLSDSDFEQCEKQKYNERKKFIRKWKKINPEVPVPRKRRSPRKKTKIHLLNLTKK